MKMLVLGDSTTFGAELSDLPSTHFGKYGNDYIKRVNGYDKIYFAHPSNLAWPALLAQKLNCTVSNQSLIGGSNDRIFRLAIEETLRDQWDLVICAWTSVDRFDVTDGERDLSLSLKSHWNFSWVKDFTATHWNIERADINFVTKLIALQSYFAQRRQPYLFVKSINIGLCQTAKLLEQQLDQTYCVDWDNDFYTWAQSDPRGPDGHILEQGHQTVADIMYQHVCKLQVGF